MASENHDFRYNFETDGDWTFAAVDMTFPAAWPILQKHVLNDQILILSLYAARKPGGRTGWGMGSQELARRDIRPLLTVRTELSEELFVIPKAEVNRLCTLLHISEFHWVDCSFTPTAELINRIFVDHFKDDLFEEELTREFAEQLGSSMMCFSVGRNELRVESKDRKAGTELLESRINDLIRSAGLEDRIKLTEEHLGRMVDAALPGRGSMKIRAKDIRLTDSGFTIKLRGQGKNILIETKGNKIEINSSKSWHPWL